MIRVILALIGFALIFIWLGAPISRKSKMFVTVLSLVAAIGLVVLEVHSNKPREGMVDLKQLVLCDQQIEHSYRSDFRVNLCLENQSDFVVKRIEYSVTAQQCQGAESCEVIQVSQRDRLVNLKAQETKNIQDTLRFEKVDPESTDIVWSARILSIKAVPN